VQRGAVAVKDDVDHGFLIERIGQRLADPQIMKEIDRRIGEIQAQGEIGECRMGLHHAHVRHGLDFWQQRIRDVGQIDLAGGEGLERVAALQEIEHDAADLAFVAGILRVGGEADVAAEGEMFENEGSVADGKERRVALAAPQLVGRDIAPDMFGQGVNQVQPVEFEP
jgi:hypothetical protein